jgi:hypothetical protein
MTIVDLKLKQASAVLGVDPKDLQNLAQMKVLRRRAERIFIGSTIGCGVRQSSPFI